jgi:hypothetical protein
VQRHAVERLLPTMFQLAARPGSPLDAALHVLADLHEPDEALLASVESIFDPYRTPDAFVPWLTRWVGLDWLVADETDDPGAPPGTPWRDPIDAHPPGLGHLRDVVAAGAELAQWRGTEVGMRLFLTAATGISGFAVSEPPGRPFHLEVTAPAEAAPYAALLRRIVNRTKPASTTAELIFAPAPATDVPVPSDGPEPTIDEIDEREH